MISLQWIESKVSTDLQIRQVYGFIFDADGRILVLEDQGVFTLPGGRPEGEESLKETLVRESLEEAQVQIGLMEYLGYQLVEDVEPFAQVRLIAILVKVLTADLDPSTGRQYRRMWVSPQMTNQLLGWGDSGDQQIASALAAVSKVGVPLDAQLKE